MGIPAYFSYIIKNYANIIRSLQSFLLNSQETSDSFTHLYMDCNSIVYDSYYELETVNPENIETLVIERVIQKIEYLKKEIM